MCECILRIIIVSSRAVIEKGGVRNRGGICVRVFLITPGLVSLLDYVILKIFRMTEFLLSVLSFIILTPVTLLVFAGKLPAVKARDYAARRRGSACLCESHR